MRETGFGQLVKKSIERTKLVLFRTFSMRKWLTLLFIAAMAGALSSGGYNGRQQLPDQPPADQTVTQPAPAAPTAAGETAVPAETAPEEAAAPAIAPEPLLSPAAVAVIIAIALIISLIFVWLSTRFRFIWYHAVVNNVSNITEPFKHYRAQGNSLFKFFLAISIPFLLILGAAGWMFFAMGALGWPALILVLLLLPLIPIMVYIEDFVVPLMALEAAAFKQGWRSFAGLFGQNKKDFIVYLFVKLGLGIVVFILQAVIAIAVLIGALIAGAVLFGIPYLIFVTAFKAQWLYAIFAVLAGIPAVLGLIILMMSVMLPFAMFFRSFSLYFLSSLKSGYEPLPLEA